MVADSDIVIVNQPLKRRESKSGKVSYRVEMKSEPLVFNLDPKVLGETVSNAIAAELRAQVQGITAQAAPATLKARERERKAYAAGKPWALKRFTGGKMGDTPPTNSTRVFNNSGRFAQSIAAGAASGGRWIINFAANRLDPQTGNVERIWSKLLQHVPAFAQPALLLGTKTVRAAVQDGLDAMVTKAEKSGDELSLARARNLALMVARVLLKAMAA